MKPYGLLVPLFSFITLCNLSAQNITEIAKSDPLIITGAVGTQNTYYYSSSGNGAMSPMSNSVYANLNFSVYGINMPFSFYLSNNNTSFSYPQVNFSFSPSYKDWTLHIGHRSMPFSSYIYNIPFDGVGLEYNGQKNHLRFGAFYGRLQKSINDDPTDPTARNPQYERRGWGLKVGYGTGRNYLDLYFFRAKDRISSLDDRWYDRLAPQDNLAVALRARVSLKRFFSLNTNVAWSVFSTDTYATPLQTHQARQWDNLFDSRYSTLYRFAGDVSMAFSLQQFNLLVSYKMIQPDYKTLGSNYISNNMQSLGLSANGSLAKGRISLSGAFSGQEDNLSREQLHTMRGFVYQANSSVRFTDKFTVNLGYNGYLQRQYDGTAIVNDTVRINRMMNGFSLTPTYTYGTTYAQSIGLSGNYLENTDLNKFNDGDYDVTTLAIGANYNINVSPIETDFNLNLNHQDSKTTRSKFSTNVLSAGASRSFLKERTLTASANLSASWNKMDQQRTFSIGIFGNASYLLKKVHAFSFSASYNKYDDFYLSDKSSYQGFDFTMSLSYNYTFTLLSLARKAKGESVK